MRMKREVKHSKCVVLFTLCEYVPSGVTDKMSCFAARKCQKM